MNTELKPGMMALVIGAYSNPSLIGKTVEIVEEAPEEWIRSIGHGFIVTGAEPLKWALRKHLMPINPQADHLHTKEEQHASA